MRSDPFVKPDATPHHGVIRVRKSDHTPSPAGRPRSTSRLPANANITRGRLFEKYQRQVWQGPHGGVANFEFTVQSRDGRRRRIDLLVTDARGDFTIIEFKASDWDKMAEHRVRPNLLRHINQIMEYLDVYWESDIAMNPALVYPNVPESARKAFIEEILDERRIQVVWMDE